jgi:hypothetical protein
LSCSHHNYIGENREASHGLDPLVIIPGKVGGISIAGPQRGLIAVRKSKSKPDEDIISFQTDAPLLGVEDRFPGLFNQGLDVLSAY